MTLASFPPQRLDDLALRVLDLASLIRSMSNKSRENDFERFELHSQKIDEWLTHLEDWALEGSARLDTMLIKHRGKLRANGSPASATDGKSEKRAAAKKSK